MDPIDSISLCIARNCIFLHALIRARGFPVFDPGGFFEKNLDSVGNT